MHTFLIWTWKSLTLWPAVSPYNITPESHINVMRRKEMINNNRSSWFLYQFSLSAPLVTCLALDKLENFWQNFSRFVICDVVPFWRWLTHGNVSIRPWLFEVWITLSTGEISIWWITQYVLLSFIPWITIYLSCWIVLSTLYTTWPKSNINRQSTHHKSNLVFQKNVMPLFFLMGKSWILFRGS